MQHHRTDAGDSARVTPQPLSPVDAITRRAADDRLVDPERGTRMSPRLVEAIELVTRMLERRARADAAAAGKGGA